MEEELKSKLKRKRLEKGLSLDEVEEILKIRKRHLKSIEEGNYTDTPGLTYAVGYFKIYATLLELSEEEKKEIIDEIYKAFNKNSKEEKEAPIFGKEVIKLTDKGDKELKEKPKSNINIKKVIVLTSIVVAIGIIGFFGFKILTQGEEFSFSKKGIYTPYAKITVKSDKNLKVTKKTNNKQATPSPTLGQGSPIPTPSPTPVPKVVAKFKLKVIPKKEAWAKVYTKQNTLFEGIMLKDKEYVFKSDNPIDIVVENSDNFSIYENNKVINLPKGSFIKYTTKEINTTGENG